MTDAPQKTSQNRYDDAAHIEAQVKAYRHRHAVGAMWEEMGTLQMSALMQSGLEAHHSVLDAGAGSLRLGRKLIDQLHSGHYYATDLHESLLHAGYDKELTQEQRGRLPLTNLAAARIEDPVPFSRRFSRIIAWSLFSHLGADSVRAGLTQLAQCLEPDGRLLATFFLCDGDPAQPQQHPGGIISYPDRDPFHFTRAQIKELAGKAGLRLIGSMPVDHPRSQTVLQFERQSAHAEAAIDSSVSDTPCDTPTVCVLGMHRSGTSLLAGSLQAAGVHLGEVNQQAAHNRKGNRENIPIRDLNDRILARHGFDWKTPPPLDALPLSWTDEERAEGRACLDALSSGPGVVRGFKDPRAIWTLEGWMALVPDLKMVGVFRAPGSVVNSLSRRDGELAISEADALALWQATNRRLLALAREHRFPLLHFDSANMASAFFAPLSRVLSALGVDGPEDGFFDAGLVHNADVPLKDAMAASVYAELLREAERGVA